MSESETEGGTWRGEGPVLWSGVEAGPRPGAADTAAAGAVSALLLQVLNYSELLVPAKDETATTGLRFSSSPLVGPV